MAANTLIAVNPINALLSEITWGIYEDRRKYKTNKILLKQ